MTTRTHLYSIQASLSIDAVSRMMGLWLMRHFDDCGRDVCFVFCVCVRAFVFEYLCLCICVFVLYFRDSSPKATPSTILAGTPWPGLCVRAVYKSIFIICYILFPGKEKIHDMASRPPILAGTPWLVVSDRGCSVSKHFGQTPITANGHSEATKINLP